MTYQSILKSLYKNVDCQRLFRSRIGVKEVDQPTYVVHPTYQRFNQKFCFGKQVRAKWDPVHRDMIERGVEVVKSLAAKGIPGYSLLEQALRTAAGNIARSHPHVEWRWPNLGFLSWTPLSQPIYEKLNIPKIPASSIQGHNKQGMATLIKEVSCWFGASLVGIALLDRRWVYSHWFDGRSDPPRNPRIVFSDEPGFESYSSPTQLDDGTQIIPKELKYVIVVAHEEDYESLKTIPSAVSSAGILNYGYQKVVHIVAPVAEFIRGLGFHAIPTVGDTCLKVPMAVDAGIGEDARNGMVITLEYGPRIRMGAILTDLPLTTDKPISFGIHEFCLECKKCAQLCPGQAISHGDRTTGEDKNDVDAPTVSGNPGALRWIRNHERCVAYRISVGGFCGICRRVCPWNLPAGKTFTLVKKLAIKQGSKGRRVMREFFEAGEYGKKTKTPEWWTQLNCLSKLTKRMDV